MNWNNVRLIFLRELRDQLRDRRTLFTIAILPILLYPLMGMTVLQVQQFLRESPSRVLVIGGDTLPSDPVLLDGNKFALDVCPESEQRLIALELAQDAPQSSSDEAIREYAQKQIKDKDFDAVVFFPPDFGLRIEKLRSPLRDSYDSAAQKSADRDASPAATDDSATKNSAADAVKPEHVPEPLVIRNSASDKSRVASHRIDDVLHRWRERVVQENLRQSNVPLSAVRPFELTSTDIAEVESRRAAIWSKILPFVLLVWALTGAFYPAIDLCAGEKERGTLETLLSSPAGRSEIVVGKLLTVMSFSVGTSVLNLASMGATGTFIITQMKQMSGVNLPIDLGPPPLFATLWLLVALIPIAALFSALSLAIAAFARSSKEGQYYLMPLLLISLPLMTLPLLPSAKLDLGFSFIPITGVMLLLRTLIEGEYFEALRYSPIVIGVTAVCCILSIRWAVEQFSNESVLFRESERFGLGLWLRHLVRDRQDLPTAGEAMLCGVLLLVIRFFVSFVIPMPASWQDFVNSTAVLQIALIAAPACLMAIMLTRRPLETLMLRRPSYWLTLPAAVLLAATLHPTMIWISTQIGILYPLSDETRAQLAPFETLIMSAPLWQAMLLIAVTPAICEELAFRGFILSGLRTTGHKWPAIVISSIFFGLAHGVLQQSLAAVVVGCVIGYVAVKSGSLWTGVLYHLTHNALSLTLGRVAMTGSAKQGPLAMIYNHEGEEFGYTLAVTFAGLVIAIALAIWLKRLPYHRLDEELLQEALADQTSYSTAKLST